MSILETIIALIIVIIVFSAFTIIVLKLLNHIERLEDFIMNQKDMISFNNMRSGVVKLKSKQDEKIEKEQKDFHDYMEIMGKGLCDDKDIKRFGVTTVDQG